MKATRVITKFLLLSMPLLLATSSSSVAIGQALNGQDPANTLYNYGKPLAQIVAAQGPVTEILVDKSDLALTLYHNDVPLKSYRVAIGEGGYGDKVRQGDKMTPEGVFYLTQKEVLNNDYFLGTRWMRVSYPNAEDAIRGYQQGLITAAQRDEIINAVNQKQTPPQYTALGGGVGIHGGSGNNPDTQGNFWTYGCVGLADKDVNEIYDFVSTQTTKLVIQQ